MVEGHSSKEHEMFIRIYHALILVAVVLTATTSTKPGYGQLVFYYDPGTGNVAFDTENTRTGKTYTYTLGVNPRITDLRFRRENQVFVWSNAILGVPEYELGEFSYSEEVEGYFTVGDILPPGLSEEIWLNTFVKRSNLDYNSSTDPGRHTYRDIHAGGGYPIAEFVYGQPDREFDNRWDIIDPDTLDWATSAKLIYFQDTGEMVIDTTDASSGHITGFILQSPGQFDADNFTPWIDVPFTTANSDVIGFFADAIEPGVYPIGAILPAGLGYDELRLAVSSARFAGRVGYGGSIDFDFEAESIGFELALVTSNVPEPNAASLLMLAVGALGYRHKRTI